MLPDDKLTPSAAYENSKRSQGLAYLFERFPSFSQTFCFREVDEMRNQGIKFPIFSIRTPKGESQQTYPAQLAESTQYLPKDTEILVKKNRWDFGKHALIAQKRLIKEWGDDRDRRRIYEAIWLAPVLQKLAIWHIHVHFAGLAARTAYWLKKLAGIRYSFTAHANDFLLNSDQARLTDLFREAEFVATVSDFSAELLRERFPRRSDQIHRVFNGIAVSQFARKRDCLNPPRILSVGRYIEKKGFSDLIRACAALKDERYECLIVGEGPLEEALKGQVRDAGLEGKVFITGPRTANEVADLLNVSSLFVLSCRTAPDGGMDNLPTVIMEAMAASVPVVATRLGGIPEMVVHGETGYLITEGDYETLAFAMKTLLQDPVTAEKMGKRGRVIAQKRFDISATVGLLQSLLIHYGGLRCT